MVRGLNNYVKFEEFTNLLAEDASAFKSIKYVKREFYPRNFELSNDFIRAFKKEHSRLINAGLAPKPSFKKLCKALMFYTV